MQLYLMFCKMGYGNELLECDGGDWWLLVVGNQGNWVTNRLTCRKKKKNEA